MKDAVRRSEAARPSVLVRSMSSAFKPSVCTAKAEASSGVKVDSFIRSLAMQILGR
jgi:hypothetical protein